MSDREWLTTLILGRTAPQAADAILASDWLARVKTEAKAEALREAVSIVRAYGDGPHVYNHIAEVIEERAAATEKRADDE